jgi:hypothetical protein
MKPDQNHRAVRPKGIDRVREGFTGTKLQAIIDVLSGARSEWDPHVVKAVRMVLIDGLVMKDVLEQTGVKRRQFDRCMDHLKQLLELVDSPPPGVLGERQPRVERARDAMMRLLGRHHLHGGAE